MTMERLFREKYASLVLEPTRAFITDALCSVELSTDGLTVKLSPQLVIGSDGWKVRMALAVSSCLCCYMLPRQCSVAGGGRRWHYV